MKFTDFKDWALLALVSGGVYILWTMSQSVVELNYKIAVIIEKQESGRVIDLDHELRIREMEKKIK